LHICIWYIGLVTEQYKRKPNTFCLVCKKQIYKRPGQVKENSGNVFCSNACYGFFCRKETPCSVCKKPILSGLNKKTCSRACANEQRTGIVYDKRKPRDKVVQHRTLKHELTIARGEKCERCGYDKSQILQIHHINRNRKDNRLSNLELICPNCHYEEHTLKR